MKKRPPFFRRLKNVSIAKKLYFTVGIMALLIAIELMVLFFSINTLSSVRAYVGGEGLWSKAQKDAIYQLLKYGLTREEADYRKFRDFMKVPQGDHRTRLELSKDQPDMEIAREGFLEGRVPKEDVDGMIKLFRRFHSNFYIHRAIEAWTKADEVIGEFEPIGEELHAEITSPSPSQERINAILRKIDPVNVRLTLSEDEFSFALGEGSRWLENVILKLLFIVALTVECTGLTLAITVSRGIQKSINEILESARAVRRGDFSRKAKIFSLDEIGKLAGDFNEMAEDLERLGKENREVNASLERKVALRTAEIESKSKEIEQFAYVASHDLQEPLRTISGFVELLQKQYRGKLDGNAEKYLDYIVQASERSKVLIEDLLEYSRIGREKEARDVDCNQLLQEVLADLDKMIRECGASIKADRLPMLQGYPTELKLLFQNLITNSIKFHRPGVPPEITVRAGRQGSLWQFCIADNGIGIEKQFLDRIFIIFQRLHTRSQYGGSGIGLAHCKKIAELHGGRIWVDSTLGEGSRFFFTINGVG
ncbi:MAG: ATP-binding protein [Bacteroidota bacterium]|nr:ATP-binding protein [Bacteroidota bacterium]MDP4245553.1 ATP-binding protein [Bacteroidota bacterium]MDP4256166.1 ATP-binding protein [Bacteroidota bacterium]MDP4257322.1 ATP-binding protein [Bacteroidota bacterium]